MSKITYEEIKPGKEALLFIEKCLKDGLTLSQQVVKRKNISGGSVLTSLPPDTDISTIQDLPLEQFRYGGITQQGGALNSIVAFIRSYLEGEDGRIAIFENANARANDPGIIGSRGIVVGGNEVYQLVLSEHSEAEIRNSVLSTDSLWIHIGFLCSVPNVHSWKAKSTLSLDDMELLADRTEYIIVGAFDGEGYLIWHTIA